MYKTKTELSAIYFSATFCCSVLLFLYVQLHIFSYIQTKGRACLYKSHLQQKYFICAMHFSIYVLFLRPVWSLNLCRKQELAGISLKSRDLSGHAVWSVGSLQFFNKDLQLAVSYPAPENCVLQHLALQGDLWSGCCLFLLLP